MPRLPSMSGLFILCLFISWINVPCGQSQALPGTAAKIGINNLAKLVRQQWIYSPLFRNNTETWDYLEGGPLENVTETCKQHYKYAIQQLFNTSPELWTVQMFDAYGKIPSGILSGHFMELGDFWECVRIRGNYTPTNSSETQIIKGRYCRTSLGIRPGLEGNQSVEEDLSFMEMEDFNPGMRQAGSSPTFEAMLGACFPDSCSAEDVQQYLNFFHSEILPDLASQTVVATFTEEKPSFDAGDITMIVVLVLIGAVILAGTLLDLYHLNRAENAQEKGLFVKILLAFSFYTNSQKWAGTQVGSGNLGCLHGMRFLSMCWVVLCHTFLLTVQQPIWNTADFSPLAKDWKFLPIMNGAVSVDTFFTLSGALMAYGLLKELDQNKGKFNYPMMIIHRYLRLTPTYAIILGIFSTLFPYMGNGPYWNDVDAEAEVCRKYGWHNMLYINNLVKYDTMYGCYGESWYLAVDMQLFLLAPLVIYPLWRWKKIGFGIWGVLVVASVIIPGWITAAKDLPPALIPFIDRKTFQVDVNVNVWTRFGPYVIGIGLGYLLRYRSQNPDTFKSIPKAFIALGWMLSTALALIVVFAPLPYFNPENAEETYTAFHATAYAGLHRTIWGVVIAWIVFACVSGYGGFVDTILSAKIFLPLGRLTFCMYISSNHIQMFYHLGVPHAEHYSLYRIVNLYFAHMVMCGLIAFLLSMCLESPFIQLEKLLFSTSKDRKPKTVEQNGDQQSKQESPADDNDNKVSVSMEGVSKALLY